jgi:hypothetical protein
VPAGDAPQFRIPRRSRTGHDATAFRCRSIARRERAADWRRQGTFAPLLTV